MRTALLALIATASLAGAALGQPAPPSAPTPASQSDELRRDLRLRPDQETALQAYVGAMQIKPGEAEHFRAEAQSEQRLPTPQRLDAMMARMDEMRASLVTRIGAIKAFYGALSPEQQRLFDTLPPPWSGGAQRQGPPPGPPPPPNGPPR